MCKELEEFRSVVSALAKDKSSVGKKNITAKRFKEWQKEIWGVKDQDKIDDVVDQIFKDYNVKIDPKLRKKNYHDMAIEIHNSGGISSTTKSDLMELLGIATRHWEDLESKMPT